MKDQNRTGKADYDRLARMFARGGDGDSVFTAGEEAAMQKIDRGTVSGLERTIDMAAAFDMLLRVLGPDSPGEDEEDAGDAEDKSGMYRVVWKIDVGASSPGSAALRAAELSRNADSTATVYEVTDLDTGEVYDVDTREPPRCGVNLSRRHLVSIASGIVNLRTENSAAYAAEHGTSLHDVMSGLDRLEAAVDC
jgi:hypothetical protein